MRLMEYFDAFTERFLLTRIAPKSVDVELLAPDWGNQHVLEGARLVGISYDPHDDAVIFDLEVTEHRVGGPREVWTIEEEDGFLSTIEVVRQDGTRELVSVRRVGIERINRPDTDMRNIGGA
jgi:hypothetical protein